MSYGLSFGDEFFWGESEGSNFLNRPISVVEALDRMKITEPVRWQEMAQEIFGLNEEYYLDTETVLRKLLKTNTCTSLTSPVEVWIDPEGYYTVRVFDRD